MGAALAGADPIVARVALPRLAALRMAGELPVDRLITHRSRRDDVTEAFPRMRRGEGARTILPVNRCGPLTT